MTTYDNDVYSSTSGKDDGQSTTASTTEDDHEERTRWDEKRSSAVKSMREGLALGSGDAHTSPASETSTNVSRAEEEAQISGNSALEKTSASATSTSAGQHETGKSKEGGRRWFFRRVGWIVLGAGVALVTDVRYWNEFSEYLKQSEFAKDQNQTEEGSMSPPPATGSELVPSARWSAARPGQRYSWSGREGGEVFSERWGSKEGKTWGERV